MSLKDMLEILHNSDRIRIYKRTPEGKKMLCAEWCAIIKQDPEGEGVSAEDLSAEVRDLRAVPEIRGRNWKQEGLAGPIDPAVTPLYKLADLEMRLYYNITI
jgi:hypothetical protein